MDFLLNKCISITYEVFTEKYEEISNETESFEKEKDEFEETKVIDNFDSISQNGKYITEVEIDHLQKKAKFKFKLEFEEEGNIKKPRVVASVINTIKPNKVTFKIKGQESFGEIVEEIVIYLQNSNINYTTYIDFNTNLTNINETIIANFDQYTYSTEKYEIKENNNKICSYLLGIVLCYNNNICE